MTETERGVVDSFADAWDMPSMGAVKQYTAALKDASLELKTVEIITSHSVGRFWKWTTLYLQLLGARFGRSSNHCYERMTSIQRRSPNR
ncbi:hypothetical protein [Natrinema soli]|uniref:Uncharacterized protein n=1 Tax=Natrinema soli TaxID=1930624 RepID=A0ABD5SKT5_9EURY|nr:hypothetical protein [Natrinema soli]